MQLNFHAKNVLLVCLLVGCILIANALECQSPQYVVIGERGTVECSFPNNFTGVVWYDSPNASKALVTRLEKQENGALEVSGNGYESGSYGIFSNGSLIIPTVTVLHDRVLKVVLIDENLKFDVADINLTTIVYPTQATPVVESCGTDNLCLINPKEMEYLSCMYNYSRPPVLLSWYKNYNGNNTVVDSCSTTVIDGQYTFGSVSTVNLSDLIHPPLNVFKCVATGPALNFQETETSVLVFSVEKERIKKNETNKLQRKVVLHSPFKISCTQRRMPIAFVWTFERQNTSSIFVISANGQMEMIDSLNDTFDVVLDGTINFSSASYHLEGIFTCTYLENGMSSFAIVEIVISNVAAEMDEAIWIAIIVIATTLIVILCITTFCFLKKMWIHLVPSTLEDTLTCCKKISDCILSWPLNNKKNVLVFDEEGIELLRTVSMEIEDNRHNRNVGVIGGCAASIAGAAITFAGAGLLPITFGGSSTMMMLGAIVGAAGVVVNIGSSVSQIVNDRANRAKVQPSLQNFVAFQKYLAIMVSNVAIALNIIRNREKCGSCNQEKVSATVNAQIKAIATRVQRERNSPISHNKLQVGAECTTDMLQILETLVSNETIPMHAGDLREQINTAQEHPFEILSSSIRTIVSTTSTEQGKPTILTLVIMLFGDKDETATVDAVEGEDIDRTAVAGRGVDGALNLATRGVAVGNRLLLKTLDLSEDAIRLTSNVTKMAKAVTVAGIILGAVGVAVDVVFLGHAVYDLMKKEKGELAQSMVDIANVMEEVNTLSRCNSKIVQ